MVFMVFMLIISLLLLLSSQWRCLIGLIPIQQDSSLSFRLMPHYVRRVSQILRFPSSFFGIFFSAGYFCQNTSHFALLIRNFWLIRIAHATVSVNCMLQKACAHINLFTSWGVVFSCQCRPFALFPKTRCGRLPSIVASSSASLPVTVQARVRERRSEMPPNGIPSALRCFVYL